MIYVLLWFVLSILIAAYASKKKIGLGGFGAFILSLILSPLIGFIIVLVSSPSEKKIMTQGGMKKCPQCAELVKAEAQKCRFCGNIFPQQKKSIESDNISRPVVTTLLPKDEKTAIAIAIIFWVVIIGIFFVTFLH